MADELEKDSPTEPTPIIVFDPTTATVDALLYRNNTAENLRKMRSLLSGMFRPFQRSAAPHP